MTLEVALPLSAFIVVLGGVVIAAISSRSTSKIISASLFEVRIKDLEAALIVTKAKLEASDALIVSLQRQISSLLLEIHDMKVAK